MIQGDNSAGHFCTKRVNSNELFQVNRDYETENVHHRQNLNLSKNYCRYFFPICGLQSKERWGEA